MNRTAHAGVWAGSLAAALLGAAFAQRQAQPMSGGFTPTSTNPSKFVELPGGGQPVHYVTPVMAAANDSEPASFVVTLTGPAVCQMIEVKYRDIEEPVQHWIPNGEVSVWVDARVGDKPLIGVRARALRVKTTDDTEISAGENILPTPVGETSRGFASDYQGVLKPIRHAILDAEDRVVAIEFAGPPPHQKQGVRTSQGGAKRGAVIIEPIICDGTIRRFVFPAWLVGRLESVELEGGDHIGLWKPPSQRAAAATPP